MGKTNSGGEPPRRLICMMEQGDRDPTTGSGSSGGVRPMITVCAPTTPVPGAQLVGPPTVSVRRKAERLERLFAKMVPKVFRSHG